MSDTTPLPGTIAWIDLTVPDAGEVRQFYETVTGWTSSGVDMGGYSDFNMTPPASDRPVAGVCHARGSNADLPAQWLIYVIVADLDASLRRTADLGGAVVAGPKNMGGQGRYAVIRDPAGAVAALWQPARA